MESSLLQNSLLVGGLTTISAVLMGGLAALGMAVLEPNWRRGLLVLSIVALMLPPFLVANCWLDLLGQSGRWSAWFPVNLFSMGGAVWMLLLLHWPITLILVLQAWSRLDAVHLENDPALSGFNLMRYLLWPLAYRAMGLAAIVTLVLVVNHFTVPALLQVKVLPAAVWVQFNTTFDYGQALRIGWPLVAGPLVLILLWWRTPIQWPSLQGTMTARILRRQLGRTWSVIGLVFLVLALLLSVGLPLFHLLADMRTWEELGSVMKTARGPAWHSLSLACLTALTCLGLAMGIWRQRWGSVFWLTFLIPGVLLGVGLILVLNRPYLQAIYQSQIMVVLAWTLRFFGPCWQSTRHACQSVDSDLLDTALMSGANRWETLRSVHWPQVAPQALAICYVVYLFCLWDVETLILIVPPGGETLALRVFNLLHYGHNAQVNALCLVLLGLALAPLALVWICHRMLGMVRERIHKGSLGKGLGLVGLACSLGSWAGCTPPHDDTSFSLSSTLFDRVEIIGTRGSALGQFNKPRSVAVDPQNDLYVVDMTGRVQVLSPKGEYLRSWHMPQTDRGKPKGLTFDTEGHLVVLEPHYARVNHFDTGGTLVEQWGGAGTDPGLFTMPRDVAVNSRGDVIVCEYTRRERVQVFGKAGRALKFSLGGAGANPGEFNRPEGVAVDGQDRIYVADSCNHRIQIFSAEGRWLASYGRPGSGLGEMSYPYDILVDKAGRQYVCEFGNSRIQVFDAQHRPLEAIGELGYAPGQFHNPWGLALDSEENLYVADAGNHRIQKLIRRK